MVHLAYNFPHMGLELAEIDDDAGLVEALTRHAHFHFPVMAVQVFALLGHHGQLVGGGE